MSKLFFKISLRNICHYNPYYEEILNFCSYRKIKNVVFFEIKFEAKVITNNGSGTYIIGLPYRAVIYTTSRVKYINQRLTRDYEFIIKEKENTMVSASNDFAINCGRISIESFGKYRCKWIKVSSYFIIT